MQRGLGENAEGFVYRAGTQAQTTVGDCAVEELLLRQEKLFCCGRKSCFAAAVKGFSVGALDRHLTAVVGI